MDSLADKISEIVEATPDRVVMRTRVIPLIMQPGGSIHGGINAYLAEHAANTGARVGVENGDATIVGLDLTSTHLLPVAEDDVIKTVATPVRRGGRIQVWKVEQFRESDGQMTNVSQLTMYTKKMRA